MSIKPLPPESIETFSLVLNPSRTYTSSSLGATGSVKIFANPSNREKEVFLASSFVDSTRKSETLESVLHNIQANVQSTTNISVAMADYMNRVNLQPTSAKNLASLQVLRHAPTTQYTINTAKKQFVQNSLMPYYRAHRPSCNWAYVNFHSLNFFTASSVPPDAAWLYPNVVTTAHPSGSYSPTGSFTIEFFINPRYTSDNADGVYNAGTILHLSSSYALSLVSGSSKNSEGKADAFRLLLQLSSSADTRPSLAVPGTNPSHLAYLSDDNALKSNTWNHVLITWGTMLSEAGTGSFYVDGTRRGTFVYPSASILPRAASTPDVLCVGNYYEGNNAGSNVQIRFFAADTADREGLYEMDGTTGVNYPNGFIFRQQLNAELHDLSIREGFVFPSQAAILGSASPKLAPAALDNYMFYLPPFFLPGTPNLKVVNGDGGVLKTPFYADDGASNHPFNADMSFGVAGHYSSLENFSMDFATGHHARLLHLTASTILGTTSGALAANDYLYLTNSVRLRNLQVFPCDDGNFRPNFEFVSPYEDSIDPRFVDDLGNPDVTLISLRNMVSGTIYESLYHQTGSMFDSVVSVSPEAPTQVPSDLLAVYQRTRDASSNEVTFFDLSNLFFGERIRPGSFSITDMNVSGSNGKVTTTLRDDGNGALYRADTHGTAATWNWVGNVFYEEGLVVIKTPAYPFFGKSGFQIEFDGEKTTHVSKLNVLVDATSYNTSSNSTWSSGMSASFDVNREPENQTFVQISGINFHDDDLNIVMRAQLAQPVVKRLGDRYMIKVKLDY